MILPMVMDEEPKQPVQEVQIRIPGQDQLPFKPQEADPRAATPAAVAATAAVAAEPLAAAAAAEKAPAPVASLAATPGARPTEKADSKAAEKKVVKPVVKPVEKTPEKAPEKRVVKPADKAPEKAADRKATKVAETPPDKATEKKLAKPAEKAPEKTSEKASDKKIEKAAEKVPVKKVDKPAEKSPEVGTEDVGKPPSVDDAPHVSPTPVSKAPETVAAKPAGQQVILIGAFANAENARQLQGKIGSAGVNAYTEVLDTPDGKKTRVRAGPFPNREAADQALEKLKKIGVTGVVAGRQ